MNLPPSLRPRFVCRAVRHWHALSGGSSRHATTCAECRAYFAAAAEFDLALRRGASAWRAATTPPPSAGFERRLLDAVNAPARPPRSNRVRRFGWTAAATLAAAVAVVLLRPAGQPAGRAVGDELALLGEAVDRASRGLVETVIPTTGAFVADNPLQREFGALYADARAAVGFLAANFLPVPAGAVPAAPGAETAQPL
mgnify:CR=1 FL=1